MRPLATQASCLGAFVSSSCAAQLKSLFISTTQCTSRHASSTSGDAKPPVIAAEQSRGRFNLDEDAPVGQEDGTGRTPATAELPAQRDAAVETPAQAPHVFLQPAPLHEIPERIRPRFRVPVKRRADPVGLQEIFTAVRQAAKARFNESVDVSFRLNIDPRNSNQLVRGSISLPHGTGKDKRVAVFARGADAAAALEAGATLVGDEDLVAQVAEKKGIDADVVVATPDMMAMLGRVARILGPKGLMPNPKMGTVTTAVKQTVLEQRKGKVQFRNDKGGVVSCSIGRIQFDDARLKENFVELLTGLVALKPASVKGTDVSAFIQGVHFSSTTGKGFPLAMGELSGLGKTVGFGAK